MSTKAHPGAFDCFAKLADDEPYFVLRANDASAPALVELWASLRMIARGNSEKLDEARRCAYEMRRWKMNELESVRITPRDPVMRVPLWDVPTLTGGQRGGDKSLDVVGTEGGKATVEHVTRPASAQPCGCDQAARWVCAVHRAEYGDEENQQG